MIKLALVPVLFLIACLMSGVYGMVHNQISYTVAPEYFTKYKFYQFQIDDQIPERAGAALVGWQAAWWMGIVIGVVLIPFGLIIPGNTNYFWGMLRVFLVVTATTMLVGLAALAVAYIVVDREMAGNLVAYDNHIEDDVSFMRAGTMHNFSYLGGLFGIVTGAIAIIVERRRAEALKGRVG